MFKTSSGMLWDKKKKFFVLLYVKKELKAFLAFGNFLSNLPATDVKNVK